MQPKTWGRTNEDASENANSVGLLFTFGKFRMLDLGDLTWNKELALVHALRPKMAIMNNGAFTVTNARTAITKTH